MRPGGGGNKGRQFERDMARVLSKWFYGSEQYLWRRPGNEFRRGPVPSSQASVHTGDIVPSLDFPPPRPWPLHVQCKFWRRDSLKLYELLTFPSKSEVYRIWAHAEATRRKDLHTLLLLKENKRDPIVFVGSGVRLMFPDLSYLLQPNLRFCFGGGDLILGCSLDNFFRGAPQAAQQQQQESVSHRKRSKDALTLTKQETVQKRRSNG